MVISWFSKFKIKYINLSLKIKYFVIFMTGLILLIAVFFLLNFKSYHKGIMNPPFQLPNNSVPPHFLYAFYGDRWKDQTNSMVLNPAVDRFKRPLAITVASDGRIFVADSGNSRIEVFGQVGQHLLSFGQDQLKYPVSLTYMNHKLYVADPILMKIVVFDDHGKALTPLSDKLKLTSRNRANANENYLRPSAIQIGPDNLFYVTDIGNQCVVVLNNKGQILRHFGSPGKNNGNFEYPGGLWVDKAGTVYVSDSNNGRIEIFDKSGRYLSKIDGTQGKNGHLALPRGLVVTDDGILFVTDVLMHKIRVFDLAGNELWTLGGMGKDNGQFYFPNDLYRDSSGRIYIVDRENNRFEVFGY